MADLVSTSISVLAFATSATTLWLTYLRRGSVRMTKPTTIYFGPDGARVARTPTSKIYLRMLLYGTAKRGRVVETMFVSLTRNQTRQIFPVWVYGEEKMVRGSGLFVGETGITTNHHFLTLRDGVDFQFGPGIYELEVHAKLLNVPKPKLLLKQQLEVSAEHSNDLKKAHAGLFFDWVPIDCRYVAHSELREPGAVPDELLELAELMKQTK